MKKIFASLFAMIILFFANAQSIGIGTATPNNSAVLDITTTSKGLLIPRMTSAKITSISNPAKGLMVYDSLKNQLLVNMGTPALPNWQNIIATSGWGLNGNGGTNPSSQFIGSTDNKSLKFRINNTVAGELNPLGDIYWGLRAGQSSTTAFSNIGIGADALKLNQGSIRNVAIGDSALYNTNGAGLNIGGSSNVAVGWNTLYANTVGSGNTAVGTQALESNIDAGNNSAFGYWALRGNTTGAYNTAVGGDAMIANNTGNYNTASGFYSLHYNQDGHDNTANGSYPLWLNISGSDNVAIGNYAEYHNSGSLGSFNTAVGVSALFNTTNSQYNTAIGFAAGYGPDLGYNNTFLGANTNASLNGLYNVIAIGQNVTCTASSQARIGNLATNSIGGTVGWTTLSDGRYKKDLQENVKGLDFIMKLRPLTYHLNLTALANKLDAATNRKKDKGSEITRQGIAEKEKTLFTGFVAQEVEQAAKDAGFDFSGIDKPKNDSDFYGLRYDEFVVPLVKAVQEQQQIIKDLQKQIDELKALIKK